MPPELDSILSEVLTRRPAAGLRDRMPYLIGVSGSVAVGKSTFARSLGRMIAARPETRRVDIVSTDGFLLPNRVLAERGLKQRKGFPESFDVAALRTALAAIKRKERVEIQRYSHVIYDIDPADMQIVAAPDVVLLDGLHLAQIETPGASRLIDCLIYLDADEAAIETWFTARLLPLMAAGVDDPKSFYYAYREMDLAARLAFAARVWRTINLPNLRDHIHADRAAADLVVRKAADHRIRDVISTPRSRSGPAVNP